MNKMLKKMFGVIMLCLSIATLSACGGDEAGGGSLNTYDGGEFTIDIDPNWKIISPGEFYAEIPKDTIIAFTAPEAQNGFFNNVSIVKENLQQEATPSSYGQANVNLANQNLTDYEKVQEATIDLGDTGQKGFVHIFTARLKPTEKEIRFVQLYTTKGKTGYIVSGGVLPDTSNDIRNQVGAMVTSFRLK